MSTLGIEKLDLSDSDTEHLFASPSRVSKKFPNSNSEHTQDQNPTSQRNGESKYDAEQARESALRQELQSVRSINEVIEGVVSGLERSTGNMDTISRTVSSASTLLDTWIRILSQTEHNQRLILNPSWHGASQDVADMENEVVWKAQAAERRAAEEERRKEEAKQRAEDEERQRQAGTAVRGARGTRGRGRGVGRTRGINGTGYVAGGSSSLSGAGRRISQRGRGGTMGRGIGSRERGVR